MNTDNNLITPFVKWAGGKSAQAADLAELIPQDVDTYIEPFMGGGALGLYILSNPEKFPHIKFIIFNDINKFLVKLYEHIFTEQTPLLKTVDSLVNEFKSSIKVSGESGAREYYNTVRREYNNLKRFTLSREDALLVSAMFLFLNKTGFNGLYRENNSHAFNVPFNKNITLTENTIYNQENLKRAQEVYNAKKCDISFKSESFDNLKFSDPKTTLIYCDPPYRPISPSAFTKYNSSDFNDKSQQNLAKWLVMQSKKKARFILSNSYCKDNFIENLYAPVTKRQQLIKANRAINSDRTGRGKVKEVRIFNF